MQAHSEAKIFIRKNHSELLFKLKKKANADLIKPVQFLILKSTITSTATTHSELKILAGNQKMITSKLNNTLNLST